MKMIGAEKMADKLNLGSLLSSLEHIDLAQSMNRLQEMLIPSNDDDNLDDKQPGNRLDLSSIAHLDPKINLLLALIPLLSANKQKKAYDLLKPLNLLYFLQRYTDILNMSE
ncbi:MAG: hypothetical protein GX892_04980 [Thermoanaerobacteraceae bacterium]|nr:hypothetical protein [Thermoanaerobacteraceae bacterium]